MPPDSQATDGPSALRVGLSAGKSLIGGLMLGIALAILLGFTTLFFYFTMTPARHYAGLRPSQIQQVYQ